MKSLPFDDLKNKKKVANTKMAAHMKSVSLRPGPNGYTISVTDTGIGMDAVRLEAIRSGKYKSSPGTSSEKGLGVGLKPCRFTEEDRWHT